jgi:bifunctional DNase/RNase
MDKIELEIIGISFSQSQSGAYALILGETGKKRRLPIIIGSYEAQAIAVELEKMNPTRPLTHDLFKNFATTFKINLLEVIIYKFSEGIFFAKLICNDGKSQVEIDSRTSDAVALAIRFKCKIFTYESILKEAGMILQVEKKFSPDDILRAEVETRKDDLEDLSVEELKKLLDVAISEEAYEKASRIRDEINKRK